MERREDHARIEIADQATSRLDMGLRPCHSFPDAVARAASVATPWFSQLEPTNNEASDRPEGLGRVRRVGERLSFEELPDDDARLASWEATAQRWTPPREAPRAPAVAPF